MSEWLKEHAWKACKHESASWVRIPLSPPVVKQAGIRWGCSSVGRAPRSQRGGHRFDPGHLHHYRHRGRLTQDWRGLGMALSCTALTASSRAIENREPRQDRKVAAASGNLDVPRTR